MSTFVKGDNGILYVWDTVELAYRPVACLTSNSLSKSLSIIESQTKCDPGQVIKQAGTLNYSLAFEGQYIDTTSVGGETTRASHDYLSELQDSQAAGTIDAIIWKLDTNVSDANFKTYYGNAIISDLELSQGSGDEISTFSGTFEGSGLITETDPNAGT